MTIVRCDGSVVGESWGGAGGCNNEEVMVVVIEATVTGDGEYWW